MNKHILISACFAWVAAGPLATAQELIKLPPGNFSCEVKVTPRSLPKPAAPGEPPAPPHVAKIKIVRTGNIRRDTVAWSDNSTSEVWSLCREGLAVTEVRRENGEKYIQVLSGTLRDSFSPRILLLTPETLFWITRTARVQDSSGTEENPPVHYRQTIAPPSSRPGQPRTPEGGNQGPPRVLQAWIDPATLLPVKLDDGTALYELSFSNELPETPLQIPTDLDAQLRRWQNAMIMQPPL